MKQINLEWVQQNQGKAFALADVRLTACLLVLGVEVPEVETPNTSSNTLDVGTPTLEVKNK
jgi:hypothetical protein